MNTRKKGSKSEDIAKRYLLSQGYKYIERNYYCPAGEIDLIFKDDNELVFVEVKSSKGDDFGQPEERIDRNKIQKLAESANIYLAEKKIYDTNCRFDVVSVIFEKNNRIKIKHIQNAFWADE